MTGKLEKHTLVDAGIQATLRARMPIEAPRKEKTRLAASLLFFEHGIYPSAKVVLAYTQQGSLTDINRDLHEFWQELRDKARVRLDAPYLPEELQDGFADALGRMWELSVTNARACFEAERLDAQNEVARAQRSQIEAERMAREMSSRLQLLDAEMHQERERREIAEKLLEGQKVEILALKEALVKWQDQAETEAKARQEAEVRFSRDLESERLLRQSDAQRFEGEIKFSKLQIDSARTAEREIREQLKALAESKDIELSTYRQRANKAMETVANIQLELAEVRGLNRGLERQLASMKSHEDRSATSPLPQKTRRPKPLIARALTVKKRRLG